MPADAIAAMQREVAHVRQALRALPQLGVVLDAMPAYVDPAVTHDDLVRNAAISECRLTVAMAYERAVREAADQVSTEEVPDGRNPHARHRGDAGVSRVREAPRPDGGDGE